MKRLFSFVACLIMLCTAAAPAARAEEAAFLRKRVPPAAKAASVESAEEADRKVVRVGWYESTYCFRDQNGERRGIAYEYQRRIAAHTGWTYEYVEDSWPNLLQMLIDGEIDLLSDVSFKEERSSLMSFSSLAMGAESYYLYIDADNREIDSEDLQTISGRRIGVNKGSYQAGLLRDWAARNGISVEIVELTGEESDAMSLLSQGGLDAYVTMDSQGAQERVSPVCKVGSSDYYFAVNKDRPDLLAELNNAMNAIVDEDPYFNQRMFDQYVRITKTNAFLPQSLDDWLNGHGTIRVGYLDDDLPFCAADKTKGELTGALKEYLAHASGCLKNTKISFGAMPYSGTDALLEALKTGEVDCVFPVNISTYYGEENGIMMVNPVMRTEMSVLMRSEERTEIPSGNSMTVAIQKGNINYETFVRDSFPEWTVKKYPTLEDCFRAAASKDADAVPACNYHVGEYEPLRTKYKLADLPTGEAMGLSFAVGADSPELYSILNKITNLSTDEDMEYALASYMYLNQRITFMDFLRDNLIVVIAVIFAVFMIVVILLVLKMKADRRADRQQNLLEEAVRIAELKQTITSLLDNLPGMNYTKDAGSGVYLACNQTFAEHAGRKSPEDVVGLTDAEIFEAGTAKRLAEEDKIALSLDEPYIFFEDIRDASGELRHIKTTKQKYTDTAGRLCVLGVSIDVTTDTFHIHRGAAATKEAYEKARIAGIIYTHIAQALARGYTELYYVDLNSEEYIEYRTDADDGGLVETRRGWHFFEEIQELAERLIYQEDRDAVVGALDRRTLVAALDRDNTFTITYRLIGAQGPTYVSMKVTRMQDDDRYIILGVADVDEQMKQRNAATRMEEEQIAYNRLRALAGDFLFIYLVEPDTGQYREFSASAETASFVRPTEGSDFFTDSREEGISLVYPEDRRRFISMFTRENVMADVERSGIFTLSYRLSMDGSPRYVQLKAVMLEEKEGRRLIVGVNDIDAQVRQEEYVRHLAMAQKEATIDPLTGVKNRHAYLAAEERLNVQLSENRAPGFAIVILDVNDLKKVNDNEGHKAGDQFLRDACRIICNIFKKSPVYRVGGDEFTVISQGDDYANIDALVRRMEEYNAKALQSGGIVIACGMAKYENDRSVARVFERADQIMYRNKSDLKERKKALHRT